MSVLLLGRRLLPLRLKPKKVRFKTLTRFSDKGFKRSPYYKTFRRYRAFLTLLSRGLSTPYYFSKQELREILFKFLPQLWGILGSGRDRSLILIISFITCNILNITYYGYVRYKPIDANYCTWRFTSEREPSLLKETSPVFLTRCENISQKVSDFAYTTLNICIV